MKLKRKFKYIAFMLIASLLLSVVPFGNMDEYKADVSGYGCGLYVHCGMGPNGAICLLCGQPSSYQYGYHASNNVWVADNDSTCHTNCGICYGTMTTTGHSWGGEYVSGTGIYHNCTRCGRAVYVRAATYTVTFYPNGGSGSMAAQTFNINSNGVDGYVNPCLYTRTGYTFARWNTASNATGTWVSERGGVNFEKNTNLFAIWSPNNYTVTFVTNSLDTPNSSKTVTYDAAYGTLPTPVKTGYTFKEWNTKSDGTGTAISADTKMQTAGNVMLYAQYTPNVYRVRYYANTGNSVDGVAQEAVEKYVTYETPVDLTVDATKNMFSHIGWALSPDSDFIIESFDSFKFGTDEHYENYMIENGQVLPLYAMYSPEVSDLWKCELAIWNKSDKDGTYAKYEMTRTSSESGGHIYKCSGDVTGKLKNTTASDIEYAIHMTDNAKNTRIIGMDEAPVYYNVTVVHQIYSIDREQYEEEGKDFFYIQKGEKFTPPYSDAISQWYEPETTVSEFVVDSEKTIEIKYYPKAIEVKLDACGGTVEQNSVTAYMNTRYPELPQAEREGHTFTGWYTQPDGKGDKVLSSNIYPYPNVYPNAGPTTLHAGWQVEYHDVIYNYEYNYGDNMDAIDIADKSVAYGQPINLAYKAYKQGYEHIGWTESNDEDDAASITPLEALDMGTKPITLYGIYEKQVDFTFVDLLHPLATPRTDLDVIYNREVMGAVTSPVIEETDNWRPIGWTRYEDGTGGVEVGNGNVCMAEDDTIFYAVYDKEITVSYETNHPEVNYEDEHGTVVYNCCGETTPYHVTLPTLPKQTNYTFTHWELNGEKYPERYPLDVIEDSHFVAVWDQYPTIIVDERYFTLKQANDGVITEAELLKGVTATDREDGSISVTLEDFHPDEFIKLTNSADISVTYVATDSIGNRVERPILIHVVRSEVETDTKVMSTRFIEKEYFNTSDPGVFVDESEGGLRNASVWKNEEAYSSLLTYALANEKTNIEYKDVTLGNTTTSLAVPSSGEWDHTYDSHTYTYEDIKEIKAYVKENGFANYKSFDAREKFIDLFTN